MTMGSRSAKTELAKSEAATRAVETDLKVFMMMMLIVVILKSLFCCYCCCKQDKTRLPP